MNVTLTLPDDLVKKCRKIAVDHDTTLTGLIREHLQNLAAREVPDAVKRRQLAALHKSLRELRFDSGGKLPTREERNERPSKVLGTR